MSSHLKQAICRVSQIGHELAMQPTGDDLSDLAKAKQLRDFIHEVKEMFGYACDSLEGLPDNALEALIRNINAMDEDGELDQIIKDLEEATDEDADGPSRDYVKIV